LYIHSFVANKNVKLCRLIWPTLYVGLSYVCNVRIVAKRCVLEEYRF